MKIPDYKLNIINSLCNFYVTRVGGKTDLILTSGWKPLCKKFIYFYPNHPDLKLSNLSNIFCLDNITDITTSTILLHNESFPEITYKDSPIKVSLVNSHRTTKLKLQGILNDYGGTYSINLYRVFGEEEDVSYKDILINLFNRLPIEILLDSYKKRPKIINLGYIKLKKNMKEKITLNFNIETKNIVRNSNYKDLEYSEFINHVNQDEVEEFIYNTLRLPLNTAYELRNAIRSAFSNKPEIGVRHCDTYKRDNSWRVQLHINFRIFPEALYLMEMKKRDSPYLISYAGKDLLMLTFSVKYV